MAAEAATISQGPSGAIVHASVETLSLTIRWSNNFTAVAQLTDEKKEDCIFHGKFVEDEESEVLVTGCTPDELSVQIQSSMYGDELFTVTREGKVNLLEPGDEDYDDELLFFSEDFPQVQPGRNGRTKREDDYYDLTFESEDLENLPKLDDYEVDDNLLPSRIEMQLSVYLDPAFVQLHGRSRSKNVAKQVVEQAGLLMKHSSIVTKVKLVPRNRFYNSNKHLGFSSKRKASENFLKDLPRLLKPPYSLNAHPITHVYLTVADGPKVKGVALGGSVCAKASSNSKRPRAIISYHDSVSATGVTMAHELGHVLGMFHDFQHRNHRTSFTCGEGKRAGKYILNYGNRPRRTLWSDCSNEDFKAYYFRVRFGNDDQFCLEDSFDSRNSPGCSPSQFQCPRGGRCIPASQRCDGLKRHCPGGEDESGCPFIGFD